MGWLSSALALWTAFCFLRILFPLGFSHDDDVSLRRMFGGVFAVSLLGTIALWRRWCTNRREELRTECLFRGKAAHIASVSLSDEEVRERPRNGWRLKCPKCCFEGDRLRETKCDGKRYACSMCGAEVA